MSTRRIAISTWWVQKSPSQLHSPSYSVLLFALFLQISPSAHTRSPYFASRFSNLLLVHQPCISPRSSVFSPSLEPPSSLPLLKRRAIPSCEGLLSRPVGGTDRSLRFRREFKRWVPVSSTWIPVINNGKKLMKDDGWRKRFVKDNDEFQTSV